MVSIREGYVLSLLVAAEVWKFGGFRVGLRAGCEKEFRVRVRLGLVVF